MTSRMRERYSIARFWQWFDEQHALLERQSLTATAIDELERMLFEVERFDWEIARGQTSPHALTLSPANRSGLRKAQCMVAQAPHLADWEFWAGKPAKRWTLTFEVERNGAAVLVDGKTWEFVVHRRSRGSHDLLLKPPTTQQLSEAEADCAAIIIVDGELGEAARLELIASIETVGRWAPEDQAHARKLEPGKLASVLLGVARD